MPFSHFSIAEFPGSGRSEALEEIFSPLCGVDIEVANASSQVDARVFDLPGLAVADSTFSDHRATRSHRHLVDGDDSMVLVFPRFGTVCFEYRGGSSDTCSAGGAYLLPLNHPFVSSSNDTLRVTSLGLPASWIESRLKNPDSVIKTELSVSGRSEVAILLGYVDMLMSTGPLTSVDAERLSAVHLLDLVGLVMDTKEETAHVAQGRGLKQARFTLMRKYINANMGRPDISINTVALEFAVSPQYVRQLFRESGTTFSDFLNGVRLDWVHRQLLLSKQSRQSISSLAYQVGFNNLAWFNRIFRSRFGMTPTEVLECSAVT